MAIQRQTQTDTAGRRPAADEAAPPDATSASDPVERRPPRRHTDLSPMGRWVEVLNAFLRRDEWGVRELALDTGLPRSAVHRILHEMHRQDLLTAVPGGHFRVGPLLVRTAVILADRLDVTRVARPILDGLTASTGETSILCLYAPNRRQFWAVDAAESAHPIRYIWESLRDWNDLHLGSSGKGILAFLPPEEQGDILTRLPDPIPGLRPVPKSVLRQELVEARERGYVVSRAERIEGAVGAAAPIRDATGRVVGDIVISWPDNRTSDAREEALGMAVRDAAAEISRALGYSDLRPSR